MVWEWEVTKEHGCWQVAPLVVLRSVGWLRYWTEGVLCYKYRGGHWAWVSLLWNERKIKLKIMSSHYRFPKGNNSPKAPQLLLRVNFQTTGIELGCTSLHFVMKPRRLVFSTNHDWRQNEVFHLLQHLFGWDFTEELVSLFHNLDSIFQNATEKNEGYFHKYQSKSDFACIKKQSTIYCLSWHLQG